MVPTKKAYLGGGRIMPPRVRGDMTAAELIDGVFSAYNAARLREGARLFARKMLAAETTVAVSLTGALTPAGYGISCLIPLVEAGFVDWIVSTGANLYHDMHFGLGLELHQGSPFVSDVELRRVGVIRIYDIFFDYDVLLDTDAFVREVIKASEFHRPMSSAEFHNRLGRFVAEREMVLHTEGHSLIAACYRAGVPVYTSSPGDSSIGMNVAAMALAGSKLTIDPNLDVNETAAIVYGAKTSGGKSGVLILGGGSPKNFVLQTEPQIQEVLGLPEKGHDYFLQITDARPDTGGLSGATPSEAVSWGKIDPDQLPNAVVVYTDTTIALPLLAAYALANREARPLKRLYDRREELVARMREAYLAQLDGAK
ncbi:MAG: deoxyhypusine synthase [Thermoanaerobaculaceae bacterium]|jgi:deoxyhypusine synthase